MVIGGGDTGNDCVGTSIRLGANICHPAGNDAKGYRIRTCSQQPMAAMAKSLQDGLRPGRSHCQYSATILVSILTTVSEFIKNKNGELVQAKLVKLQSKKDEKSGRMMMVPIEGSEEIIDVDIVLIAAGFLGSQKYVTDAFKVNINGRTNVDTAPGKYQTSVPNVFTAGDMHRGQSLVVWAIREGREAAKAVDESLMGYTNL